MTIFDCLFANPSPVAILGTSLFSDIATDDFGRFNRSFITVSYPAPSLQQRVTVRSIKGCCCCCGGAFHLLLLLWCAVVKFSCAGVISFSE